MNLAYSYIVCGAFSFAAGLLVGAFWASREPRDPFDQLVKDMEREEKARTQRDAWRARAPHPMDARWKSRPDGWGK